MLIEFFYKILILSLSGTIIFFIVAILKILTKKVLSPYWNYLLAIITLLTFILPYGVLMPSLQNDFWSSPKFIEGKNVISHSEANEIKNDNVINTNDKSEKIQKPQSSNDNTVTKTSMIIQKTQKDFTLIKNNLGIIWLIGFITFISSQLILVVSFKKKLKANSLPVKRQEVKELFYECCKQLGISKEISLMVCGSIGTPMATGIFNTVITIPNEEFDLNILKMIFKHELMHYKRRDLWAKAISFFVLSVHWFNPVIYLVNKDINKYCELSCDFQVIKDMSNDDKKYYGLAILTAMDNSISRKISLSTPMSGSSKNQLKERLIMIKSSKSPKKIITFFSVNIAFILVIAGAFINSALVQTGENKKLNDFAVMVKENSLYAVDLSKLSKEVIIDKDGQFKNPRISPNGENVAYTKGQSLYVVPIDLKQGQKEAINVDDKIVSYAWGNNDELVYSTENGGLNSFSLKTKKSSLYVKNQYHYEDLASDKKGNIYGNIYLYYTKDDSQYIEAKGLIKYNLALAKESLIIPARPWNDENGDTGLNPVVAGISKDGNFVYIWCKTRSGSLNSDGVPFGLYDVKNDKFIQSNSDQILALSYKDNLAINPQNGKIAVLNNGGARNMNINKTIVMANLVDKEFETMLPQDMISTTNDPYDTIAKGMVTMTPAFSPDGKEVIFSAANATNDTNKWLKDPHNIYTLDVNTKKLEKITTGNSFDFAPKYILKGKGIVFARKMDENNISLFRLKDNKEECISKDIKLNEDSCYYGHCNLEQSLDIYTVGL